VDIALSQGQGSRCLATLLPISGLVLLKSRAGTVEKRCVLENASQPNRERNRAVQRLCKEARAMLWEALMERRAFLQLLCFGMGVAAAAAPAKAFTLVAPVAVPGSDPGLAPEPSVATAEDIDRAQVEKVYFGHWRRVNRRLYRRVSRRVYRRHYYY
jgi:hypothetical protein